MNQGTCTSCMAPILWASTEKGKAIPLDRDPVPDGNLVLVEVDPRDAPVAMSISSIRGKDVSTAVRYVSHKCSQ